ncbi:MAG: alkaline phosphatase family protein [Opitutales bacterium]
MAAVRRTALLNIVGLTPRLLGEHTPYLTDFARRRGLRTIEPILPAVTCTAQATYLTGQPPSVHGIVANGWYDRQFAEHRFWKQSNRIVEAPKLWESARQQRPDFACAQLFWWFNMYSSVNYSVTPRPLYFADGKKVFDIHTQPMALRESLKTELGPFPFRYFWGPASGLPSSEWIAACARWIEQKRSPHLSLVYLPHLDYNLQRLGPNHPDLAQDLRAIDTVVNELVAFLETRGVTVGFISEYGITPVDTPVHLNRLFLRERWLSLKDEGGTETLDLGSCRAFAIADHQVAHIYVSEESLRPKVIALLEKTEGVGQVLHGDSLAAAELNHPRAGDIVAIAAPNAWFTYYYWEDDTKAPDFARCVDIHRKPGFDPVELFIDPDLRFPKLHLARRLLQKKLGFRMLMDVIPLRAELVKGSHGHRPDDPQDWPILAGDFDFPGTSSIAATDVHAQLLSWCL